MDFTRDNNSPGYPGAQPASGGPFGAWLQKLMAQSAAPGRSPYQPSAEMIGQYNQYMNDPTSPPAPQPSMSPQQSQYLNDPWGR